ncbi:DsbA family oxidoreductase [Xanthomonas sp. GPE 39]|uniref:DsbA family oxidoreductase n=1 Tax=Xanthomonas sp. GPE 39 TaxID=1583099 RepID=UPI0005F27D09|nr:DsbA family oxidoreductase [Xanthomonas sp. GPE 39]
MRIDIWSDVVCPWCWIGRRRLQQGIALLGADAAALDIHWHPYLIDPEADFTPVPLREAYASKFGGPARTEQILMQTQSTARADGLPLDFGRGQVRVTTLPAHRVLWLAAREGNADAVAEALFHAHFAQGRNLAQTQTLLDAGAAGGLPPARVQALLDGDEGLVEIQAQLQQAQEMGIRAVPVYVIDGRQALQGAQPPEVFAATLRGLLPDASASGRDCGAEVCAP